MILELLNRSKNPDSGPIDKEGCKLDKVAVLIPCYNEERTIEKVVHDFRNSMPEAVIYVYDNNSTDRTAEIAGKAGAVVWYEHSSCHWINIVIPTGRVLWIC